MTTNARMPLYFSYLVYRQWKHFRPSSLKSDSLNDVRLAEC